MRRILRNLDRAEDAPQQTLVIAWRQLPRLRDPDRFEAWIHPLFEELMATITLDPSAVVDAP